MTFELLEEAHQHFSEWEMKEKLNLIFTHGWGFEGWFQNELLVTYLRNGHNVNILGKVAKDTDIIVDGYGLELKCWKKDYPSKRKLINAFKQHPNSDGYLFLLEKDEKTISELKKFISNLYIYKMKDISNKYAIMMISKKKESKVTNDN